MIFLRHALIITTILLTVFSSPTKWEWEREKEAFRRLLDGVDETSVHSILHSLAPKFQDGIFSKDRSALEQVHSENPKLASRLIKMAKRQSNSTTTTTSPAQSSIASVESSLSSAASSASVASASLSSAEASLSSELAASSARTASVIPAPTTVVLAPSTPAGATAIGTTGGAVIFSDPNGGVVTVASSTAYVTYARESSTVLSTYTLPDGSLSTLTSVIIVNAPITATVPPPEAGAAATTGGAAGLQSGAANPCRGYVKEAALMMGGAAAIAIAL